jgi:hypothetical protein
MWSSIYQKVGKDFGFKASLDILEFGVSDKFTGVLSCKIM